MKIKIHYKIKDELEKYVDLTPEEYFDPIDEDETYENDAIPKFNHAEEYLEISTEMLEWTNIEISETNRGQSIKTQYFDEGKSWMIHRKDLDGYEEIILSSQLNSSNVHIARVHKDNNENWQVNYDGVITDLEDGSQSEQKIF
ncbi:MAG: hypothetical protein MUC29_09810 [Pyrinomonadaceae bacterium]|jgi:hypothetical protein|nr:hypothetical protein [Pyrinomonadaceae bacterium]